MGLSFGFQTRTITRDNYVQTVLPRVTGQNGYEEYVMATAPFYGDAKWQETLRLPGGGRGKPGYLEGLRSVVAANQRTYQLVVQGNSKPVIYPQLATNDLFTLMPELAQFKKLMYLFSDKAEYEFATGQPLAAYQTTMEGFDFARNVQKSGPFLSFNVGTAMLASMMSQVKFEVPPDYKSCQGIVARCDKILKPANFEPILESEMGSIDKALRSNDPDQIAMLKVLAVDDDDDSELSTDQLRTAFGNVLDRMTNFQGVIKQAGSLNEKALLDLAVQFEPQGGSEIPSEKLVDQYKGFFTDVMKQEAILRTWFRLLRLSAMIWEFRWTEGKFPDSLDDLVAGEMAVDSFTGRDYEYKLKDGRFEVWSQGYRDVGEIHIGQTMSLRTAKYNDRIDPPVALAAGGGR